MNNENYDKDLLIKNLLETYSVRQIIGIFSTIDEKIHSLHDASAQDFMALNNMLKKYHVQAKQIQDKANQIFTILSNQQNEGIYGDLNNLYKILNAQAEAFDNQFTFYYKLLEKLNTNFNLTFVPVNNCRQNITTLRFLLANIKLNAVFFQKSGTVWAEPDFMGIDEQIDVIKKVLVSYSQVLYELKKHIDQVHHFQDEIEKGSTTGITGILNQIHNSINLLTDQNEMVSSELPKFTQFSENYVKSVGQIITNLQYQDIIRQKMEHIEDTHKEIIAELNMLEKSNDTDAFISRQVKYISEIPDIAEIQVAQLVVTNRDYQNAIDLITKKLFDIKENLESISSIGHRIIGFTDEAGSTKLDVVKQNLVEAVAQIRILEKVNQDYNLEIARLIELNQTLKSSFDAVITFNSMLQKLVRTKTNMPGFNQQSKELKNLYSQFTDLVRDIDQNIHEINRYYHQSSRITRQMNRVVKRSLSFSADNLVRNIESIVDTLQQKIQIIRNLSRENVEMSHTISEDIKTSIQDVKYYDYFEKVVEEIINELNHIFARLKTESGQGLNEKLESLKALEEFYTMQSERMIHHGVLSNRPADSGEINTGEQPEDDNIELF